VFGVVTERPQATPASAAGSRLTLAPAPLAADRSGRVERETVSNPRHSAWKAGAWARGGTSALSNGSSEDRPDAPLPRPNTMAD
jgi:hypothetical protein